jgi:hypothetical protein
MAIGTINRLPEGVGAEQYDAVMEKIGVADAPVDGLIFHSAGELEGSFQVFNVWETREHFDRFTTERLRPAQVAIIGEERLAALPDADIVHVDIHNYVIP